MGIQRSLREFMVDIMHNENKFISNEPMLEQIAEGNEWTYARD